MQERALRRSGSQIPKIFPRTTASLKTLTPINIPVLIREFQDSKLSTAHLSKIQTPELALLTETLWTQCLVSWAWVRKSSSLLTQELIFRLQFSHCRSKQIAAACLRALWGTLRTVRDHPTRLTTRTTRKLMRHHQTTNSLRGDQCSTPELQISHWFRWAPLKKEMPRGEAEAAGHPSPNSSVQLIRDRSTRY